MNEVRTCKHGVHVNVICYTACFMPCDLNMYFEVGEAVRSDCLQCMECVRIHTCFAYGTVVLVFGMKCYNLCQVNSVHSVSHLSEYVAINYVLEICLKSHDFDILNSRKLKVLEMRSSKYFESPNLVLENFSLQCLKMYFLIQSGLIAFLCLLEI